MRKLAIIIFVLFRCSAAFAAIAEDSTGTQSTTDFWVTSKTYTFTNTAGTFMAEQVWTWSCAANPTHDTSTYNGTSLTKDKDQYRDAGGGCHNRASSWSLQSPSTGSNSLVINFSGNTSGVEFNVTTMTGVATSSALDTSDGFNPSCASISRAQSIANNGTVIFEVNDNAGNMTPTASQTERGLGSYIYGVAAGTKTLTWSLDSGCTGGIWSAVAYKQASTTTNRSLTLTGVGQ